MDLLPPELLTDDAPWTDAELTDLVDPEAFVPEPLRERGLEHDEHAAWALATVAKLNERLRDLNDQADAYRQRITDWQLDQSRPLAARAAFLAERLERYALAVRDRDGTKTLRLPSGDVKTTSHAAKVVIDDEQLLAAWLHERLSDLEWEDVANVSVSLRVSELRKLVAVMNDTVLLREEPVPYVRVEDASVTAKVTAAPGERIATRP